MIPAQGARARRGAGRAAAWSAVAPVRDSGRGRYL